MKMKLIFLVFLLFTLVSRIAFSQTWQWANSFGSISIDAGGPLCLDSSGNIYVSGNFLQPFCMLSNDTLFASGINDIFIVKINSNGNFIWAKRAGGDNSGTSETSGSIIYETSTNKILLVGRVDGSNETIDSCQVGSGIKIVLTKLDLNGDCIWSITECLNSNAFGVSICSDNLGNIYMYGVTQFTSVFNGGNLSPGGFIAKFNSADGVCQWVKNLFNTNNVSNGIKYYNDYLYLSGTCKVDTLNIDTSTIVGNYWNPFIAKFDTSGMIQWVKTMGGINQDDGTVISLDSNGNIYTTGTFKDTAYFDSIMLTDGSNRDWFLSKYDNNGNAIWIQQAHADSIGAFTYNAVDNQGNIYVVGSFFGNATFGSYYLSSTESQNIFIAKYDSSGICLGAIQLSDAQYARIACDINNDFYVCGGFIDTVDLDNNRIISHGLTDVFLAKHDAITNIEEGERRNDQLRIYANPTVGKCNITVPDEFLHETNLTLNIYDNTGKLIQQQNIQMTEGKIKLNLEAEAKGIYNVTLSNGKKTYSGKIVFE